MFPKRQWSSIFFSSSPEVKSLFFLSNYEQRLHFLLFLRRDPRIPCCNIWLKTPPWSADVKPCRKRIPVVKLSQLLGIVWDIEAPVLPASAWKKWTCGVVTPRNVVVICERRSSRHWGPQDTILRRMKICERRRKKPSHSQQLAYLLHHNQLEVSSLVTKTSRNWDILGHICTPRYWSVCNG